MTLRIGRKVESIRSKTLRRLYALFPQKRGILCSGRSRSDVDYSRVDLYLHIFLTKMKHVLPLISCYLHLCSLIIKALFFLGPMALLSMSFEEAFPYYFLKMPHNNKVFLTLARIYLFLPTKLKGRIVMVNRMYHDFYF